MIVEEEEEVALPLKISDFCLQAQKSLNFEPSGVQQQQKTIELDASQLERHSALYNLEHSSDLPLEHIFSSHSPQPPIQQPENKKTEMIDRQLLSNLFKRKPRRPTGHHHDHPKASSSSSSKSKRKNFCNPSKMLKKLGLERLAIFQPRSGRDDDLDDIIVTSPAAVVVAPQDDPRSPINPSTIDRVSFFKSFRGAFS